MASPQKENGYTAIANELMDAIVLLEFPSSSAHRILLFVIRKTYGYNKKNDAISLSQFERGTGLSRGTINIWISELVRALILVRGKISKNGVVYGLNKDYEQWVVRPPVLVRPTRFTSTTPHTHKRQYTKDNIVAKATVTKNSMLSEEPNEDGMYAVPVDDEGRPLVKPSTFGRYPARIAKEFCALVGKRSVGGQLKAAKELMALALQDFPKDTREQHFAEIMARVKIAKQHYDSKGVDDFNLLKVAENWDKTLKNWL